MTGQDEKELEATYGPAAPYSEHQRGERIRYISAEDRERSGVIVWVQARFQDIPMKYIVNPDDAGFLDFVLPLDIIAVAQEKQEPILHTCPYCFGQHDDVEVCPLNPNKP